MISLLRTLVACLSIAVSTALVVGQESTIVTALEAKGVKFKKDKAGLPVELSTSGAEFTADDYKSIGKLTTLRRIWMSPKGAPFNDEALASMAGLENLEYFFANGAKLTDDGFRGFAGWKNLKQFGLDHWFGPEGSKAYVGKGLGHLAPLSKLEIVRLGGCRVDNAACEGLAQVKSLRKVDLFHTFAVNDAGIPALKALPELRIVILGPQFQPRITDSALETLGGIATLEELEIHETWLTWDNGLRHLAGLPKLKKLTFKLVIADEADVAKLKAAKPDLAFSWTKPDDATVEKTKATFRRFREKQKSKS